MTDSDWDDQELKQAVEAIIEGNMDSEASPSPSSTTENPVSLLCHLKHYSLGDS
jgi:hypothetical protein